VQIANQKPEITFAEVAADFIAHMRRMKWRSESLAANMKLLLGTHAFPLAAMRITDITSDDVKSVIREATQQDCTFRAIRQMFEFAIWEGYRDDNPAHSRIMTYMNGKQKHSHFKAMDYNAVPAFIQELRLRQRSGIVGPAALEHLILTACRASEVAKMRWEEINWEQKVWTIPAHRMKKSDHNHRVPLCERALELLKLQCSLPGPGYVWTTYNGAMTPKAMYLYLTRYMGLPYTIHGFRASFSSWCYDKMEFPEELVAKCLAHQSTKVIGAYRRTDALERRRGIMEAWASYCQQQRG
jgi:integrase